MAPAEPSLMARFHSAVAFVLPSFAKISEPGVDWKFTHRPMENTARALEKKAASGVVMLSVDPLGRSIGASPSQLSGFVRSNGVAQADKADEGVQIGAKPLALNLRPVQVAAFGLAR